MQVKLVWATPNMDEAISYIARVSNPSGQDKPVGTLFKYMMREGHSSPFEMANACLEINVTRDIGRQILRHRSFSFQEFSQRYQSVDHLPAAALRETRLQDAKNRQNSLPTDDQAISAAWASLQQEVLDYSTKAYSLALKLGVAKEQARAVLPEGLTPSRMYMNGTMRSWIFYLKQRLDRTTQKEHRLIAQECLEVLRQVAPITMEAFFPEGEYVGSL